MVLQKGAERQEPGNEQHLCGDVFAGSREGRFGAPLFPKNWRLETQTAIGRGGRPRR